jgi:hypothetical protein
MVMGWRSAAVGVTLDLTGLVPLRRFVRLLLPWPAPITGDAMAANPLLRSFTAVVHGFAHLPCDGFTRGLPTDMRGFPTEDELVADEAARAVRILARAAAGQL